MRSSFSPIPFLACAFVLLTRCSRSSIVSPVFSSRSFIIWHFESLIYFELKFCKGLKGCVEILSLAYGCPLVWCHLWDCLFSVVWPLFLCERSVECVRLWVCSLSIRLSALSPGPHCPVYCACSKTSSQAVSFLWRWSSPSVSYWLFWVLCLSM